MAEDAMLQLSTAPRLPKGNAHVDAEDRPEVAVVSPPARRATDLTKTSVPLPFMLTTLALVVSIAAGVWRIDARVSVIDARLDARETYDKKLEEVNQRYLDQLAKTLEAQITIAGLRSSLLAALEPTKVPEKPRVR